MGSAFTASFVNISAFRFGSDGWNFKKVEQAIASKTSPSCHKNAANTARKLSAKPAGSARFGYTFESIGIPFSFSSFSMVSPLSIRNFNVSVVLLRVFKGDAHSCECESIEMVVVRFICLRGDCNSIRFSFNRAAGKLSN